MLNISNLNEAQRDAVMHGEGPALVIAGPGSGKTHVITKRISYLIEEMRVSPEKILVITFTKEAAVSMQQRFQCTTETYLPVHFGTFHSVFYHILRESCKQTQFNILSQKHKIHLLLSILKQFPIEQNSYDARDRMQEDATSILSAISFYKNTGDKQTAITYLSEEWSSFFDSIFEKYEQERQRENAIDFDDMVYECKHMLQQNEHIRNHWQEYFSHILIDEFQDINPMQYEVIKLLSKPPYSIFAVGDDDQSIYGFRGSKPACLQQFCKDYQAKQIYLNINYRSNAEIVNCSLKVINENKERFLKELRANDEIALSETEEQKSERKEWQKEVAQTIICQAYSERTEQYQALCKQIKDYLKENPNNTCAVLFRTNSYMQSLAAMLNREGILYQMKESAKCIYDHWVIKDIMAYMSLANEGLQRNWFLQVMNKPMRYISRNALGSGEISFADIQRYYQRDNTKAYHNNVLQALEVLQNQLLNLKGKNPFLAVQYICKVIGYEKYLNEQKYRNTDKREESMEILRWMAEDARHYATYEEWIMVQNSYRENLLTKETGGCKNELQPQVQLMTVHGSKGLEFHQVWIPDCNEKIFPHGNLLTEGQVEEERRIFYVGLTRAKENLGLLYLVGTKERPRMPSRFLNPVISEKNYSSSSTISSNSQLSKYSSNASATFSYSSSSSMKLNSGSSFGSSGFSLYP